MSFAIYAVLERPLDNLRACDDLVFIQSCEITDWYLGTENDV